MLRRCEDKDWQQNEKHKIWFNVRHRQRNASIVLEQSIEHSSEQNPGHKGDRGFAGIMKGGGNEEEEEAEKAKKSNGIHNIEGFLYPIVLQNTAEIQEERY